MEKKVYFRAGTVNISAVRFIYLILNFCYCISAVKFVFGTFHKFLLSGKILFLLLKLLIKVILKCNSDNSNIQITNSVFTGNTKSQLMLSSSQDLNSKSTMCFRMLFFYELWTSFLASRAWWNLGKPFPSCQLLAFTAQFLAPHYMLFVNCQMPQGKIAAECRAYLIALSFCPVGWLLIWAVSAFQTQCLSLSLPLRWQTTWLRFPGFQPLISALLFSLLVLCHLPISKWYGVNTPPKSWTHLNTLPFSQKPSSPGCFSSFLMPSNIFFSF